MKDTVQRAADEHRQCGNVDAGVNGTHLVSVGPWRRQKTLGTRSGSRRHGLPAGEECWVVHVRQTRFLIFLYCNVAGYMRT